jgi:hypothetical protein
MFISLILFKQDEMLVPIRINIAFGDDRPPIIDSFMWNVYGMKKTVFFRFFFLFFTEFICLFLETELTPEQFAESFCLDMDLSVILISF